MTQRKYAATDEQTLKISEYPSEFCVKATPLHFLNFSIPKNSDSKIPFQRNVDLKNSIPAVSSCAWK